MLGHTRLGGILAQGRGRKRLLLVDGYEEANITKAFQHAASHNLIRIGIFISFTKMPRPPEFSLAEHVATSDP
jgi:hypothetical protein